MKRFFAIFSILSTAALALSACGSPATSLPDCKSAEVFCVGVVTEVGKINDKSFNQAAWQAASQAEKSLKAEIQFIETTDWKDYEKNISTFGEAGYDVIITVGYNLGDATFKSAINYPNSMFIGVDQVLDPAKTSPTNLVSLSYPEDQAGFLAGALAIQMTQSGKIGAVCGTDIVPPIWRYCEGYKAGAIYINPGADLTVVYHNDVSPDTAISDPEWGASAAKDMINNGVDVVFSAGGTTGDGAIIAAAQKSVYVIGSEYDQYNTLPEARKMLLTSAVKLIETDVYDLIKMANNNKFPTSGTFSGAIGLAPFHNWNKKIPDDVKAKMQEIASGLVDGSINTNVSPAKP